MGWTKRYPSIAAEAMGSAKGSTHPTDYEPKQDERCNER